MNILMNCNGVYSQAMATLAPSLNVVPVGSTAAFTCFTSGGSNPTGVTWLLNSSRLEELNLSGVSSQFLGRIGGLTIANVSTDLNSSTIQCRLSTSSSGTISSPNAQLSVQGTLGRVNITSVSIQDQSVTIIWEAPFTLDLTNVDPDITYCVDVMDSLDNTLYSQCGINTTSVTIPLDTDLCTVYTITPVNPAGNGTKNTNLFNASNPACVEEEGITTVEIITTTVDNDADTTVRSHSTSTVFQIALASAVVFIFGLVIGCVVGVIFHHIYMYKIKKCPRAEEGPCEMAMPVYEDVSLHKTTPVIQMDENVAYSLQ